MKFEQQLESYQKLHAEEIAELRQVLNDCKRAIAALAGPPGTGALTLRAAADPPAPDAHDERR